MLRLHARAKINWTLDIQGQREDGYHWMDMLMQSVDLGDMLTIAPSDMLTLQITGSSTLAENDNLVLKAARALQAATGISHGAAFGLEKRTPIGAGMGGGSADAAAALIGLNQLWNLNLDTAALNAIGLTIGADVPFLLKGGLARVSGIGEVVEPILPAPVIPLVIVQPCQALLTGEVFTCFDQLPAARHPHTQDALYALRNKDLTALDMAAENVLQQASERKRPQIPEAIAALEACGAGFAAMTGSGSAVFGAFDTVADAKAAYTMLRKRWRKCWLTQTTESGIQQI